MRAAAASALPHGQRVQRLFGRPDELSAQAATRDSNGVAGDAKPAVAAASASRGDSLPEPVMRKFEASLGTDLSSVRVHTGAASATAADAVGARAYTTGQDIHFGAGQYDPSGASGQHLLAHEVAHTVQQRAGAPVRQNKDLDVSTPGDHLEVEADRAADAMIAGAPASVGSAGGVQRQTVMRDFGLPGAPSPGTIGPFAPNQSHSGVAYDVPTTNYKASVAAAAPPLTAEMPAAGIKDPGTIPGWRAVVPAHQEGIGPFSYTVPAQAVVIAGPDHSSTVQEAWTAYKNELLPAVGNAWDGDARQKMNSYVQQAHGNPELDALVKDMKDNYRMTETGQKGKGTVSDQAAAQNVSGGVTAPQIAGQIQGKGQQFKDDLAATEKAGQDGTVAGPVGKAVDAIKAERLQTQGSLASLEGLQTQIEGATDHLKGAIAGVEIEDLKEKIDDEKAKKEAIANGQATLQKYAPEIANLVKLVRDNSDKLKTLGGMVKSGAGAMEGDPSAILELGKGVLEVAKWDALARADTAIANLTDDLTGKYKLKAQSELTGARKVIAGLARQAQGEAAKLKGHLIEEKVRHAELAKAVQNNWKGADKKDGEAAARALRAIPIVRKVLRTLQDIKAAMPALPDGSTRADQGYTLATKGIGAPGAADLMRVAGWITGSPKSIDPELQKWNDIHAQLSVVTAGLGL